MQKISKPFIYLHSENIFTHMLTVLLSIFLVLIAVVMLGIKVLFVKGSVFPSGHIHESEALRKKGITCARADEKAAH